MIPPHTPSACIETSSVRSTRTVAGSPVWITSSAARDHVRLAAAAAHRAHVPAQRMDDHLGADFARHRAPHVDDGRDRHRLAGIDEFR